jgi:hypothetical protein
MSRQFLATVVIAASAWASVIGQDKPPAPPPPPPQQVTPGGAAPRVPVRVQFVLSRYQGEKKVSSLPYVLGVLPGNQKTSLRMGIQVPIAVGKNDATAMSPYSYRDVGTKIDCHVQDYGSGLYQLAVVIEDSSIHLDSSPSSTEKQQIVRDVPVFRSFNASFSMVLREGQTMQYASATDPISGEVMRIDVTLTTAK